MRASITHSAYNLKVSLEGHIARCHSKLPGNRKTYAHNSLQVSRDSVSFIKSLFSADCRDSRGHLTSDVMC